MAKGVKIDPAVLENYIMQLQAVRRTAMQCRKGSAKGIRVSSLKGETAQVVKSLMEETATSAEGLILLIDNTIAYFMNLKKSVEESDRIHKQHVQS